MKSPQTVLITGGNGYVGRVFADLLSLREPKLQVIRTSRRPSTSYPDLIPADLTDFASAQALIQDHRPDIVFHLAGGARSRNWPDLIQENVNTTLHLGQAILEASPSTRLVLAGSAAEYGSTVSGGCSKENDTLRPISPYGVVKSWQTGLVRYFSDQGMNVIATRIFNLIGPEIPKHTAVGNFVHQIHAIEDGLQKQMVTGNLDPKRDFIDIRDASEALWQIALQGVSGEIYNICTGVSISMREVLNHLIEASRLSSRPTVEEGKIQHPLGEIPESRGIFEKLNAVTGWQPQISLAESVRSSLERKSK